MSQRILSDGSTGGRIAEIPQFRPVQADVFSERAERLHWLAREGAWQPYLRFAGAVSAAQQSVLHALPPPPRPSDELLAQCFAHDMPPLSPAGHARDAVWREGLRTLLRTVDRSAFTPAAVASSEALLGASDDRLEETADHLLAGAFTQVNPAEAPFVAAALQVYWVKLALQVGEPAALPRAAALLCPLCGSHPVASVVRIGGSAQGLRYLVCSLCAAEWHMVRVKCSACGSTKGISYLGVEGGSEAVKAECCEQCNTYLKIFHLEKDSGIIAAADDLATLALDLLVDQQGYNRIGPNLLFLPGAA
jgi:FdhE protein